MRSISEVFRRPVSQCDAAPFRRYDSAGRAYDTLAPSTFTRPRLRSESNNCASCWSDSSFLKSVKRTEQGLLGSRLRGLAPDEVGHGKLDLFLGGGGGGRFEIRNIRDTGRALSRDLLPLQMLDQRIETRVLGNNVEEGVRL